MTCATVRRVLLAGAASLTLLLAAAGCGSADIDHPGTNPTNTKQPVASSAAYNQADVMFAQMMIPHHGQAVDMTTLAESKAQDPQLKQLAVAIKTAQQPEITLMTGWLTAWGQPILAPSDMATMSHGGHGGGMPGMMSAEEMHQLAAANGTDFDRIFTRMMMAHHGGALIMAETEVANGSDPDAIALARTILATQGAEVVTLQQILDRLSHPPPPGRTPPGRRTVPENREANHVVCVTPSCAAHRTGRRRRHAAVGLHR